MLSPAEEEVDAQVRREDQDNINRFARLNARLHQINQDVDRLKVSQSIDVAWIQALYMHIILSWEK